MNDELLIKYIQQTCSESEREQVRLWLAEETDHHRLFELEELYALKTQMRYARPARSEQAYERLLHRLHAQTPETNNRTIASVHLQPTSWKTLFSYAAVVSILCLLSANLIFLAQGEETAGTEAYNTIRVPKGQRVSVTLSDGTNVWLNAESQFSYPSQFKGDRRQVHLQGEAYFDVTPDRKHPFMVQLPSLNIKVLGTQFNAKAYPNEDHCITLRQGSVEVSTPNGKHLQKMLPKDQIYYRKSGKWEHRTQTNAAEASDWINGGLRIDNLPLHEFLPDLERHYDVEIHIQDAAIQDIPFTCHFKNGVDIKEALELLKATKQIDYIIDMKDIYLYKFHP